MALKPTIDVQVELSGAGGGWTSLAADVVQSASVTIKHGIMGGGPSDRVASTGTCTFTLQNSTRNSGGLLGYYSRYHANRRTGWDLGIGCRVRMTDPDTATVSTQFIGRIDVIEPEPGVKRARTVKVTAVDWMDAAARWALTPAIGEQVNQRADQIITAIIAVMPEAPIAVDYDAGSDTYPYALDTSPQNKGTVLGEFAKLAASEVGFIYVKAAGTLRFESRSSRLVNTTSVWTIPDTDLDGITLPSSRDEVLNTVRCITHPRTVDTSLTSVVYSQANEIILNASEAKTLMGPYRDPDTGNEIGATNIQALVAGTDYVAVNGAGVDSTADISIVTTAGPAGVRFVVTNNAAEPLTLTLLQLRGSSIFDYGTTEFQASNASSITSYGEHAVIFDMPYQADANVGQAACDYFLGVYETPFAVVGSPSVFGKSNALITQILTRDIGDRITLSETVTGANGQYFINGRELTVTPGGYLHAVYQVAPAVDPFGAPNYWQLGTVGVGELGTKTYLAW